MSCRDGTSLSMEYLLFLVAEDGEVTGAVVTVSDMEDGGAGGSLCEGVKKNKDMLTFLQKPLWSSQRLVTGTCRWMERVV
jgi:hypothetical protein